MHEPKLMAGADSEKHQPEARGVSRTGHEWEREEGREEMLDLDRSLLVVEPQPPARPTAASMCTAAGWGWHRIRGCCRQGRGRGDVAICAHSRHQGRASRPHVSASNGPGAPVVPQQPTPGGHGPRGRHALCSVASPSRSPLPMTSA